MPALSVHSVYGRLAAVFNPLKN